MCVVFCELCVFMGRRIAAFVLPGVSVGSCYLFWAFVLLS